MRKKKTKKKKDNYTSEQVPLKEGRQTEMRLLRLLFALLLIGHSFEQQTIFEHSLPVIVCLDYVMTAHFMDDHQTKL